MINNILPEVKRVYGNAKEVTKFVVNPSKYTKQNEIADMGWKHKMNGTLVEAQLPKSIAKSIPTVAKGIAYLLMTVISLGTLKTIAQEASAHAEAKTKVGVNILKAKASALAEDSIVFDSKIPLPYKLYNAAKNEKTPAGRFLKSMKDNKDSLMKDLNISGSEYNEYAIMALKLSKEESQYGNAMSYKLYDAIESSDVGRDAVATMRKIARGDGDLSLGMTRFKVDKASNEEKELFNKYGVTYGNNGSNITEPEKSAVATIIHLATLGKDYPKYLENAKALAPDIKSQQVQKSVDNAKEILFNDVRRPKAVLLLQGGERAVEENFADGQFFPIKVSEQDLNDLRTYASTVILSKEAYLAGRWNGRKLLPEGERKDQACANLLNVAAQKGYLSNINKKSEVLY